MTIYRVQRPHQCSRHRCREGAVIVDKYETAQGSTSAYMCAYHAALMGIDSARALTPPRAG